MHDIDATSCWALFILLILCSLLLSFTFISKHSLLSTASNSQLPSAAFSMPAFRPKLWRIALYIVFCRSLVVSLFAVFIFRTAWGVSFFLSILCRKCFPPPSFLSPSLALLMVLELFFFSCVYCDYLRTKYLLFNIIVVKYDRNYLRFNYHIALCMIFIIIAARYFLFSIIFVKYVLSYLRVNSHINVCKILLFSLPIHCFNSTQLGTFSLLWGPRCWAALVPFSCGWLSTPWGVCRGTGLSLISFF